MLNFGEQSQEMTTVAKSNCVDIHLLIVFCSYFPFGLVPWAAANKNWKLSVVSARLYLMWSTLEGLLKERPWSRQSFFLFNMWQVNGIYSEIIMLMFGSFDLLLAHQYFFFLLVVLWYYLPLFLGQQNCRESAYKSPILESFHTANARFPKIILAWL